MEPTTTAAIASQVANLGSSILGGMSSKKSAKKSYKKQIALMQMQRQWELENYQNAHQWEMQDLAKAGINPALTAFNGTGISSPSISAPTPAMAEPTKFGDIGTQAMGTIATLRQLETQEEMAKAQAERDKAQAMKTTEESNWVEPSTKQKIKESASRIARNETEQQVMRSEMQKNIYEAIGMDARNKLLKLQVAREDRPWKQIQHDIDDILNTLKLAGETGKEFTQMFALLKGTKNISELKKAISELDKSGVLDGLKFLGKNMK